MERSSACDAGVRLRRVGRGCADEGSDCRESSHPAEERNGVSRAGVTALDEHLAAGVAGGGKAGECRSDGGGPKTCAVDGDADRLWAGCDSDGTGVSKVGLGKIVCGERARAALEDDGVAPDLTSAGPAPDADFDFVHRRGHGAEIYFVRNRKPNAVATVLGFRARGLAPEIWNAETGAVTPQGVYEQTKDGRTNLPMWLGPYGSVVVVFRRAASAHVVRMERGGQEVFPKLSADTTPFEVEIRSGRMLLRTEHGGRYVAVDAAGRRHAATEAEVTVLPVARPWTVAFTPGWGAPAQVHMDKLASWTESSEEGVRHYSGTAAYTTAFLMLANPPEHARVM